MPFPSRHKTVGVNQAFQILMIMKEQFQPKMQKRLKLRSFISNTHLN